jgi:hypothetical protein
MIKKAINIVLITALQYQQACGFGVTMPGTHHCSFISTQCSKILPASSFARTIQTCRFASKDDDAEEFEYEYEEVEYEDEDDGDAEYEYVEVDDDDDEEGVEEEEDIPLQDDPDDPNYSAQKKLIEETIARRENLGEIRENLEGPGSPKFFKENLEEFIDSQYEEAGLTEEDVANYAQKMSITEQEATEAIQQKEDEDSDKDTNELTASFLTNLGSESDAFPSNDDAVMQNGIKNEDLVRLQKAMEGLVDTIKGFEDGSLVDNKQAMIRPHYELDQLDRQTLDEINLCLNASATDANGVEYSESIKNEDPLRWLLYDLDFDVANLMLAACKHNPDAPLLPNHWMPQLCAYSRYADVRDQGFQFTWEDCENADMDELKRYYEGLGYDKIPTFVPKDTNVVELETEYAQEDMTMAAFENWMDEVYIEDDENLYFDDEDFQPENNVFDFNYAMEDSDHITSFKSELKDFKAEHRNETKAWKNKYVRETNYTFKEDTGGAEQFRGHLVLACCGSDKDLALAEKITKRMEKEFDKMIYVETRVYSHARQEDNLYEIWLESYDIELLHSRRGAFYDAKQWLGPADVDDEQLDNIVKRVNFLIGDDARFSYRLHEFVELV